MGKTKKWVIFVIAALILVSALAGCSGESVDDELSAITESFRAAETMRFTAQLRADYGERVYEYRVRFEGLPGDGTLTILEPESVAGAAVRYSGNGASIEYDGAEIYTGSILPDAVSPADSVPMMAAAWRAGLIETATRESILQKDAIAVGFMASDKTALRTWFERETGLPVSAEVAFDGCTVLTAVFEDFVLA